MQLNVKKEALFFAILKGQLTFDQVFAIRVAAFCVSRRISQRIKRLEKLSEFFFPWFKELKMQLYNNMLISYSQSPVVATQVLPRRSYFLSEIKKD